LWAICSICRGSPSRCEELGGGARIFDIIPMSNSLAHADVTGVLADALFGGAIQVSTPYRNARVITNALDKNKESLASLKRLQRDHSGDEARNDESLVKFCSSVDYELNVGTLKHDVLLEDLKYHCHTLSGFPVFQRDSNDTHLSHRCVRVPNPQTRARRKGREESELPKRRKVNTFRAEKMCPESHHPKNLDGFLCRQP
jgi:hypothetical protein